MSLGGGAKRDVLQGGNCYCHAASRRECRLSGGHATAATFFPRRAAIRIAHSQSSAVRGSCLYLERVTRNCSRAHKYTLGADLRDGTRRVLKLIVRANARYDKVPLLLEVREEIEALKVVVRLCQDVKAFSNFGAFEQAIGQVVEIAKQNEGWLKSQRQGHGQSRRAMPNGPASPGAP